VSDMSKKELSVEAALREVVEIIGCEVGIVERALAERIERIEAKLGIEDAIDWRKVKHHD
jgi:hypothetical protein